MLPLCKIGLKQVQTCNTGTVRLLVKASICPSERITGTFVSYPINIEMDGGNSCISYERVV